MKYSALKMTDADAEALASIASQAADCLRDFAAAIRRMHVMANDVEPDSYAAYAHAREELKQILTGATPATLRDGDGDKWLLKDDGYHLYSNDGEHVLGPYTRDLIEQTFGQPE